LNGAKNLEASLTVPAPPPDAAVLGRVQQDNQRQIVGKLLHDLRNPVHSIRISMELFGRLARRNGDVGKLMERAGQYIDPAEAAVASLVANSERLARYLAAPAPAEVIALPVEEVLTEVSALLKASKRRLQVTCTLPDDRTLRMRADRIRVCHVLLHTCLNNPASAVALAGRPGADGLVVLDVTFQAAAADDVARSVPLRADELQTIVETAGGALLTATAATLSMEFRRADEPPRG
jgi:signal transduction histidine kinase